MVTLCSDNYVEVMINVRGLAVLTSSSDSCNLDFFRTKTKLTDLDRSHFLSVRLSRRPRDGTSVRMRRGDKSQVFGWTWDERRKGDRPFFFFSIFTLAVALPAVKDADCKTGCSFCSSVSSLSGQLIRFKGLDVYHRT